jgi:hypothetical protein
VVCGEFEACTSAHEDITLTTAARKPRISRGFLASF